jgi:hypothetical protein
VHPQEHVSTAVTSLGPYAVTLGPKQEKELGNYCQYIVVTLKEIGNPDVILSTYVRIVKLCSCLKIVSPFTLMGREIIFKPRNFMSYDADGVMSAIEKKTTCIPTSLVLSFGSAS